MNLYPLIKLLSNGQFQTGTQLGEQLGISRAAIWKQIQQLPSLGLDVITKKNEGYCLAQPLQLLDTVQLEAQLLAANSALALNFYPVIDSTNAELARRLAAGETRQPLLLLAEMQTAGRGRRGRDWFSPYAASLSLSLSVQVETGANALQGLSLAVGVVIKEVLEQQGVKGVQLKWPNDLYLNNAKLGGILIELSGDFSGPCNLVVGVGLNVFSPQQALPAELDQPVAFLSDLNGVELCRTRLAAALALALEQLLMSFTLQGFEPWQERWNAAHLWAGEKAFIITANQRVAVTLGGVNALGELQVTYADGVEGFINAGEVSVRARE